MKGFILLVFAVIYGSLAVIILAAIAHDVLKRSRLRKRAIGSQPGHLRERRVDHTWAREDADAEAARGRGERPD